MRAAICSDIHGNLPALEAVLAEAAEAGVDELWVVGDLVAHGPHPGPTVRRLRELTGAHTTRIVRGNTDRYTVIGQLSPYLLGLDPVKHPDKDAQIADAREAYEWTRSAVDAAGCLDWLGGLPAEIRLGLPDGTVVLLSHAAPGTDDGPGLYAEQTDQEVRDAAVGAARAEGVGLVVVGHTHVPMDRTVDDVRVVNLGSVSVPTTPDPRSAWTLLTADDAGFTLEHRRTGYDIESVIADLHTCGHPSADWLASKMRRSWSAVH
jgi:predicted phosphodiesterase